VQAARRPAAAFLLAFAALQVELAWTRIAGLLFFGEAAFLVVTLAVAGLALGAALGAARPAWLTCSAAALAAGAAGLLTTVGVFAAMAAAGRGGFAPTVALAVPCFVAFGLAFAGVFAGDARHAPRLYAADLTGAALGAAASLPALAWLGAPDMALAAAVVALTAAMLLASTRRGIAAAAGLAVVLAVVSVAPGPHLDPQRWATPKSLPRELQRGAEALASRWGSVGRSDLVRRADGAEILYLDGGAGSLLPGPDSAALWRSDLGRFAFETLRPERVFVVGGGAGLEVAHALETGALVVDVAEVNRAGMALARERFAALADERGTPSSTPAGLPNPFDDPRVGWSGDEARAVLRAASRNEGEGYDLITLSQAVTRTAEARGLALTENGLYTVEATREWLAALSPGGAVAFELYDEATVTRTLITSAVALQEAGLATDDAAALDAMVALFDPGTAPPTPLLLLFRTAPTRDQVVTLARAAEARGLALLHLPGLLVNPPLDDVAAGGRTLASLARPGGGLDLAPTRDGAPFYWSFETGVPRSLRRLAGLVAALTVVLLPPLLLLRARAAPRPATGTRRGLAVATLLGVSFLALELAVLSKTGLLLGHPAGALAITLAGLLAGAGAGAAAARARPDDWRQLTRAAYIAALAAAAWTVAWPWLDGAVAGQPAVVRAIAALATLIPLGFALGAPFPLLLRRLGAAERPGEVARAWALNGLGSLIGGVGALATAHLLGFTAVALLAAGGYVAAAALGFLVRVADG